MTTWHVWITTESLHSSYLSCNYLLPLTLPSFFSFSFPTSWYNLSPFSLSLSLVFTAFMCSSSHCKSSLPPPLLLLLLPLPFSVSLSSFSLPSVPPLSSLLPPPPPLSPSLTQRFPIDCPSSTPQIKAYFIRGGIYNDPINCRASPALPPLAQSVFKCVCVSVRERVCVGGCV